jgi:hypothetical protein
MEMSAGREQCCPLLVKLGETARVGKKKKVPFTLETSWWHFALE